VRTRQTQFEMTAPLKKVRAWKKSMDILRDLVAVKKAVEEGRPLLSNQGQALDGFAELAEYRAIAERAQEILEGYE
jgi:hypothetical protein